MAATDPTLVPALLALLAAVQFAAGNITVKRGLEHADSVTGATVTIATSTVLYALAAPFTLRAEFWLSPAVWVFAAIGLLRPSVSTMLSYEGNRHMGPTITATVASLSPLFAVAGGVVFLAERPAVTTLVGTIGVVAGIIVLSGRGDVPRTWPTWALLFPLGAALIRAGAHVAARWGLLLVPSVVMAGLVAYCVSLVISLAVQRLQPAPRRRPLTRAALAWFVLAGLFNAGAIFALNTGLMLGEVVLVSPLASTFPLFTLLGSWLLLRQEVITRRTVLGVLVTVPAVILITIGR